MIATFKTSTFVSNLKAALLAASKDVTRSYLSCVRIEFTGNTARFVATNGSWLWINEAPVDCQGSDIVHISRKDVKTILKTLNVTKNASDIQFDTAGAVLQVSCKAYFTRAEVAFPSYAQIIPQLVTRNEDTRPSCYDLAVVADICAAFKEVGDDAITFHQTDGDLDPTIVSSDMTKALVVLAPRRAAPRSPSVLDLISQYTTKPAKAA